MRYPWFRHFQSSFVGLVMVALVLGGVLLWKANQNGFSGKWGEELQKQLDNYGLHADFSSVRLSFSRGLIAKDLSIYADKERTALLASVDRLYLDIDRSIALRGQWQVRSASFENAYFQVPAEYAPHHLSRLTGKASFSREGCLTITETTGRLGQLDIQLDATLTNFNLFGSGSDEPENEEHEENHFLIFLHNEISKWSTNHTVSPLLELTVKGDLARANTIEVGYRFQAANIARLNYEMDDLSLSGHINQSSLFFEKLSFQDNAGSFEGNGHYGFHSRKANFEVSSTTNLQELLRDGLGINKLQELTFSTPPVINAREQLRFPDGEGPQLNLTGHTEIENFQVLDELWPSLSSDFSWQEGNFYLRDLVLTHPEGTLTGKLLFQDENIRYQAHSTLPVRLFDPFVDANSNIRRTFDLAQFTPESLITLNLEGNIRPSNLTDWSAFGNIKVENFIYNKVPANYGSASFNLTPLQSIFTNPEAELDLTKDPSHLAFGGPKSAVIRADQISYDHNDYLTRIEHLHGVCWIAPVLRAFIPETANHIEKTYRTSEPPAFSSTGVIDHRPPYQRSAFLTRIQTAAPLYYDFLGKPVEFRETSALIHYHHSQIDVSELSSYAFSGPVNGELSVLWQNGGLPDFRGGFRWTRLRLADIGDTYDFDLEKGLITGRLDFFGTTGKIETLGGTGNFGLEQGELFKAPVFGPLSPLIAGIQGHKRASHEVARDASANFLIRSGILYTDDFITSTDSLTVKAEGAIDLARQTLDMTARADTEGILKLVTLPLNLTGLDGLFQFRGTGPISDPTWKNTPFTRPPKEKKPRLFADPPKAKVVPE